MAAFKITQTNSVLNTANSGVAFGGGVSGANSLTVDSGGFLITTGVASVAADLNPFGPWTVTVNGTMLSTNGSALILRSLSSDFSPTAPPASKITIGLGGGLESGVSGSTVVFGRPATLTNAGLIIQTTPTGDAITLIGQSANTIINSGLIEGDIRRAGDGATTITNSASIDGDVTLGLANDVVSNNKGSISGAVNLGNGNNKLTNTLGSIDELAAGSGNDTIVNSGFIDGPTQLGEGNNSLTNSGSFGRIQGNVFSGAGTDKITNSGIIVGTVDTGDGNDVLTNSGVITNGINFAQGINKLTNSGTISSLDVAFGNDADTISNTGTIDKAVNLGGGANVLTNSQFIGGIIGGADSDKITNNGTIGDGTGTAVNLGGGANVLTNSKNIDGAVFGGSGSDKVMNTGAIFGDVLLGDGDDIYIASGKGTATGVNDGAGSDTYTFGSSGGLFRAIGTNSHVGTDKVTGGSSTNDTYSLSGATTSSVINLDTKSHGLTDVPDFIFTVDFAANTATGSQIGTDIVKLIDNVAGSNAAETIFGSSTANFISGDGGVDVIMGFAGNDLLLGGDGVDFLFGGDGADYLAGGDGSGDGVGDVFRYLSISESGITTATRDTIGDFEDGLDQIWLNSIDANTLEAGNQTFDFIGPNVNWDNSGPGQLRSYWSAYGHIIEADVNGDRKADFSIFILDQDHSITFSDIDFFL